MFQKVLGLQRLLGESQQFSWHMRTETKNLTSEHCYLIFTAFVLFKIEQEYENLRSIANK